MIDEVEAAPIISTQPWLLGAIAFGLLLIAGSIIVGLHAVPALTDSITSQTLIGLLALSVSLLGLIMLSSALGLATPKAALGLPHGSVRSLLALSLVLIFVVCASWALAPHPGNKPEPLLITPAYPNTNAAAQTTALQISFPAPRYAVIAVPVVADATKFEIFDVGTAQQQQDFQKDILTVIGTLLTAVISFYFGGKSASDASHSMGETMTKLQSIFTNSATNPGPPDLTIKAPDNTPVTADALNALSTQIGSIAVSASTLLTGLGSSPMDDLQEAVKDTPSTNAQTALTTAQAALDKLTAAVNGTTTDASRSKDAIATLNMAQASASDLAIVRDTLNNQLKSATQSKQDAEDALSAFNAAKTSVLTITAKG